MFVLIPWQHYWASLAIFAIAAGTDWLDGYIARKYDLVTQLGRILDPFVDKFLICGTFIYLAAIPKSGIAAWMAVVVVARELLVTVIRSFFENEGVDFSASMAGKLKMVFQCLAVILSLLFLALSTESQTKLPSWGAWAVTIAAWVSVVSTIHSGAGYVLKAIQLLGPKQQAS